MTPQEQIVLLGAGVTAAARFGFGKDWKTAALFGLSAIAAVFILTVKSDND